MIIQNAPSNAELLAAMNEALDRVNTRLDNIIKERDALRKQNAELRAENERLLGVAIVARQALMEEKQKTKALKANILEVIEE